MTTEIVSHPIQHLLEPHVTEWRTPEPHRLDAILSSEQLLEAVNVLHGDHQVYLIAITGVDHGVEANTFEVLYHFGTNATVITLRVTIDRIGATVPSICAIFPYASPFERETGEMFGITFADTPDTKRLFLPDDWDDGSYPLRKDVEFKEVNHDTD